MTVNHSSRQHKLDSFDHPMHPANVSCIHENFFSSFKLLSSKLVCVQSVKVSFAMLSSGQTAKMMVTAVTMGNPMVYVWGIYNID